MNIDTEKKLDELLARLPKAEYDLNAWLEEDETAEFDRILIHQPRMNTDSYGQSSLLPRTDTDLHGGKRKMWHWVAAAVCLIIITGVGMTMKLMHQETGSKPMVAENNTQPLPSSPLDSLPALATSEMQEGREVATPKREMATPTKTMVAPRKIVVQVSQQDAIADTLGSSIWQREENVVTALQMLNECEQTIRREEQEVRNAVIEATYKAVPRPANVHLVIDENGDYEVIERRAIIGI